MVRDNASLSQPSGWSDALQGHHEDHENRGRAELYPATVAVLQVLSNEALVGRWSGLPADELRPAIWVALSPLDGPRDILVERIVLWLRPLRREIRPTRIDPLNVPLDVVDTASIIDTDAPYPLWIRRHPVAVAEWDWDANDLNRDPWSHSGTSAKASWVCDAGHTWTSAPYTRAKSGCPHCAGQSVWRGESDLETLFPEIADEWDRADGVNAGGPDSVAAGSRRRVGWVCREGHRWKAAISSRTGKRTGCPGCSGNLVLPGETDLATLRPDLAAEWDWDANSDLTPQQVTIGSAKRVAWKGACGHSWRTRVAMRVINGTGCPTCAGKNATPGFDDFGTVCPELVAEWHPGNALRPHELRPKSGIKVRWRCARDHVWKAAPYSRVAGKGCPFCSGRQAIAGESDLATVRPDVASEWCQSNARRAQETTVSSRYRAAWECRFGHTWKATVASRTRELGSGCPTCHQRRRAGNTQHLSVKVA